MISGPQNNDPNCKEGNSDKILAALQELVPTSVRAYRDGELKLVPAETLVPGDIVMVSRSFDLLNREEGRPGVAQRASQIPRF